MVDFAVLESSPNPSISKVVVKKNGNKTTVSPSALSIKKNRAVLTSSTIPFLPYDERDFYLNEDLLDKQVIDIDGKRLVRVNDVVIDDTKELKVIGIDIGASGIFRRLGLSFLFKTDPKIIPWQMIEAFDYRTGNIKLSLPQNRLNKMHPAELADILENLGSRERTAIVESLEASRAAKAIEENKADPGCKTIQYCTSEEEKKETIEYQTGACDDVYYPEEGNGGTGCTHKYSKDPYPGCYYVFDVNAPRYACGLE